MNQVFQLPTREEQVRAMAARIAAVGGEPDAIVAALLRIEVVLGDIRDLLAQGGVQSPTVEAAPAAPAEADPEPETAPPVEVVPAQARVAELEAEGLAALRRKAVQAKLKGVGRLSVRELAERLASLEG